MRSITSGFVMKNLLSLLAILIAYCVVTTAHARLEDIYPPYENKNKPRNTCKIHQLHSPKRDMFTTRDISIQTDSSWNLEVNFIKQQNKVLLAKMPLVYLGTPKNTTKVYWAYLNQDNKKDYIFSVRFHKSNTYMVVFLLTNKTGYFERHMLAEGFSTEFFYDYNNDQRCEFLLMERLESKKNFKSLLNKSGYSATNYFTDFITYNIISFDSKTARYKNTLSKFFPRWIEVKIKHYEAESLSNLTFDKYQYISNSIAALLPKKEKVIIWKEHIRNRGGDRLGYPWHN